MLLRLWSRHKDKANLCFDIGGNCTHLPTSRLQKAACTELHQSNACLITDSDCTVCMSEMAIFAREVGWVGAGEQLSSIRMLAF